MSTQPNGRPPDELVVIRVEDEINQALAGRPGVHYESPPQAQKEALELACVLLGYTSDKLNGGAAWTCPIAGGRRTVVLKPATESGQ